MFKMIAAYCRKNRGIGKNGLLPWRLSNDMSHFKRMTIGNGNNAVIMGKNTWESLSKRPLPKRDNLILSRSSQGDNVFASIAEVKNYCREKNYDEIWIIGGDSIYKQWIKDDEVQSVHITVIDKEYKCDRFFPKIPKDFSLVWNGSRWQEGDISYEYRIYHRGLDNC